MKKVGFLLSLLFLCSTLGAQHMKDVFLNMPDSITPLLSAVNKADFIDFLDSKMKAEVKNSLGGDSEMQVLSDDYTRIQMTKNSSWQMKILPFKEAYILGVIQTVKGPVENSCITFYDSEWKPLDVADFVASPRASDFLNLTEFESSTSDTKYIDLKGLDMSLIRFDFAVDQPILVATYTTPEYLDEPMQKQVKPFLKPTLSYLWNGTVLEIIK